MAGESIFILAVVVAAVLLVDRLGGTDELARRMFQVGLGIMLALTVISATGAFIVAPSDNSESASFGDIFEDEDAADRASLADTVRVGVGVIAIMFGVGGLTRYRTVPLGALLGGVFLLLGVGSASAYNLGVLASSAGTSREADVINLVVTAAGLGALTWFGFARWEREEAAAVAEPID